MVLVGDVRDRIAIIVDDMADTCGTLVKAADVVIEHGAREALAIVTHGILSGDAIEKLNNSKLKKLVITNTVPLSEEKKKRLGSRIEVIDISPTVSLTIMIKTPTSQLGAHILFETFADVLYSSPRRVEERTTGRACRFCSSMFQSTRYLWFESIDLRTAYLP